MDSQREIISINCKNYPPVRLLWWPLSRKMGKSGRCSHRISCSASTSNPITRERPRNRPRLHESIKFRRCYFVFFPRYGQESASSRSRPTSHVRLVLFAHDRDRPTRKVSAGYEPKPKPCSLVWSNGKSSSAPKCRPVLSPQIPFYGPSYLSSKERS